MKRLFAILILLTFATQIVDAKVKVEDRSAKKRPAWVGGYERGYIIKSARGETLDQAKSLVEASVKDEIARSLGEYVSSKDLTQIGQINGKIRNEYSSQIRTQISGIIRLTDVNMANAKGFYWERCRDRKAKKIYYEYHIFYPFSELTRNKIIGHYREMEADINAQIDGYEKMLDTFTSYEELEENIGSLKVFYDYYKDNKRVRIRNIITRYISAFQALAIAPQKPVSGVLSFDVQYKGRPISISSMPTVYVGSGEGIHKISATCNGNGWQIEVAKGQTYDIRFALTYVKLNYKHIQK